MVGQYANVILEYLDESTVDDKYLLAPASSIGEQSGRKSAQKRSMPGKNSHVAVLARDLRFRYLFVDKQTLRRRNLKLESVCHSDKLPIHLLGSLENFLDRTLHVERL